MSNLRPTEARQGFYICCLHHKYNKKLSRRIFFMSWLNALAFNIYWKTLFFSELLLIMYFFGKRIKQICQQGVLASGRNQIFQSMDII
ncbi:MAG: hypothetical protein LBR26_01830, partial [Prevotella sp.]|nr:hypothetical protein [Prevotella sp.]